MTQRALAWGLWFERDDSAWYPAIVDELLELVCAMPVFSRWTRVWRGQGRWKRLDARSLEDAVRDTGTATGMFKLVDKVEDETLSFECTHFSDLLAIHMHLGGAAFDELARDVTSLFVPFLSAFGRPLVLPVSGARPAFLPDLPWERVRRPLANYLRFENVIDVFDRRLVDARPDHDLFPRIFASPTPPGVTRTEHEGILIQQWTDDLASPEALADARMRHERWLVQLLQP